MNNNSGGLPLGPEKAMEVKSEDQKRAAVHAELERVNQLPTNSSYAVHRMKVLNKLLHLMSIKVIEGPSRLPKGIFLKFISRTSHYIFG